jgi:hypothetical protein
MNAARAQTDPACFSRGLARGRDRAVLATNLGGAPYASLVLVALDHDASPLLLLSDLAQHSRNIAFDPRVSLLLDATRGHADPLTGPRLTLLGQARASADDRLLARFVARHPTSALYSGFADFRLHRVAVERGHLVAGFGRIHWIEGGDFLLAPTAPDLAAAEPEILRQANEDNAAPWRGEGWRLTGIDPEGVDLRRHGEVARIDFAAPVFSSAEARAALARLRRDAPQDRLR